MAALTENLVLQKSKADKLQSVKNLNLWGAELTDVSLVAYMPNLEVLALSVNHVNTLRDIAECKNLKELYLRKNDIQHLGEVYYLSKLPKLQTLWLSDNPCSKDPNYRLFTVRCCPQLLQLDSIEVSSQERADSQSLPASLINDIISSRPPPPPPADRPPQVPSILSSPQPAKGAQQTPTNPAAEFAAQVANPPPQIVPQNATPSTIAAAGIQTQKTILSSIFLLLGELNTESLEMLRKEVLERQQRAVKK